MTKIAPPGSLVRVKSPVVPVKSRDIPVPQRILLFVHAGGRCEFNGCNCYLLEHHVTRKTGNYAQAAHIVAFREDGPRGKDGHRPREINNADNLMLLCHRCHKEVDDHSDVYTRRTLEEYKHRHEQRIRLVTALGPENATFIVIATIPIAGEVVQIPDSQVWEAVAPRYPSKQDYMRIDLNVLRDRAERFIPAARNAISSQIASLFQPGHELELVRHISLLALGPMPLLIHLGRALGNKIPLAVFQRHRDTEDWTWKEAGSVIQYKLNLARQGKRDKVALVLSLSGSISLADLPASVREESTVYEITLRDATPQSTFLARRESLDNFRIFYQEVLGEIIKNHGLLPSLDLFPAVPAPIAVLCGRELMPKIHPALRIYNGTKARGYNFVLEVNTND